MITAQSDPNIYLLLAGAQAMSLYQYNVSPLERATRLFQHFDGECAELADLLRLVESKNWATEMAFPTACAYLQQGIDRYFEEARARVSAEFDFMGAQP